MKFMTIGEFATRTRLSPKALRLYDELQLLVPARVDPSSGYRLYAEDQIQPARLVGLLRRLDMPLSDISPILAQPGAEAAAAVTAWWEQVEAKVEERRALVAYLQAHLSGKDHAMYDIQVRTIPQRHVVAINRHLHTAETDQFFRDAFARLRAAGSGIEGIAGCPYLVFYGEVSDDSDGPLELCRPVKSSVAIDLADDIQLRVEAEHDEVFVRLARKELGWPAILPACNALENWAIRQQRRPGGPLRQVLIADQRTADAETLVCDLSLPLRETRGGTTTMHIRAIDPSQPQVPATDTGIDPTQAAAAIDNVTLSRRSTIRHNP
jgi:DNA-binding transcriptional MerR regulator